MSTKFSQKTRSGWTFLEILTEDSPDDMAVLQLDFAGDMDELAKEAIKHHGGLKHKRDSEADHTAEPPPNALAQPLVQEYPILSLPKTGVAETARYVLTMAPLHSELKSKALPIAEGGWIATNASCYGAKVKRNLEDMKAKGFTHIPWKGKVPVCVVDNQDRVVLVAAGQPNDPSYATDAECMAELMLKMGESTDWEKEEKHHGRGDYSYADYGWSYGKGQQQPQCLGGQRQEMMARFVNKPCTQRVAAFQSASFALWFPKSYAEFHRQNLQLKEKIPTFEGNIKGSVYLCCTANCGPNSWTHIHQDGLNCAGACCTVTSGGPFDPTKGGQLIIWDLKLIFDFPPGSTILLPSALFRHLNIPIQKGEKRVSSPSTPLEAFIVGLSMEMLKERPEHWRRVLEMFSTIDELRAGIIE
ncbi:hypothetical protein BDP27DRAFT_1437082 [Rhodocollybia butyracea]|uniref:Uncharacterized protein n=1 Tax=Rhodocollybia butyracea TaxID=206335 RepID=A0A9P5P4Z6_9AGAR|nr:hypothetical protein BDP27DRAFT_1437082 [Rhodocollybia butyracea]